MEFRVLGSLEVEARGRLLALSRPSEQKALAVLLLSAGRVVPVARLVDTLWDGEPPATAVKQAQNIVGRLRRLIADSGDPDPVVSARSGYRLVLDGNTLDAREFEALVARADGAAAARQVAEAAEFLGTALGLWRGPALAGLSGQPIEAAADALNERRRSVQERYYEHRLMLGEHSRVVADLRGLVSAFPLREKLAGQLMLALYRCGRQADALAVFGAIRARLASELGLDPSPELRRLHERVLAADPVLASRDECQPERPRVAAHAPADPVAALTPAVPAPAQLPLDIADFTGREGPLRSMTAMLTEPGTAAGGARPVTIAAINGTAGVGKTALALHWAHQVAAQFPDGQLHVDLLGYAPAGPMEPAEALARFLRALGVPGKQVPGGTAESAAMFRSLLAGKRMLLLLDNAADADQVRPLLPGGPGCFVVVTSRDRLAGLSVTHGARRMTVDVLPAAESGRLLTRLLGEDRVRAEAGAVAELARLCAHLPLALRIAAANLADRPSASIAAYVTELRTRDRLTALQVPDDPASTVRITLRTSCDRISPAPLRMLRLFSLHPGPDVSRPALASLAGLALDDATETAEALIRAHLLAERTPGRLSWHDLLRLCAGELAVMDETAASREAAARRLLDHYLHTAYLGDRLLDPARTPVDLAPPQPGTRPESLAQENQALAWFEAERLVLLAAVSQAAAAGCDAHAWQIAWSMVSFLERRGYWQDLVVTQRTGLAAGERLGDLIGAARMHRSLASALVFTGALDDAEAHLRRSLSIGRRLRDPLLQGDAHLNLGWVLSEAHDYEKAITHASAALERFRAARRQGSEARALNNLGWYHMHLGRHELAAKYCEEALGIIRAAGDRYSEAQVRDSLGCIYLHLERRADALDCLQDALGTYRVLGDRYMEAVVLDHLAGAHRDAGRLRAAGEAWQQSLAIFEDLDRPEAGNVRRKLLEAIRAG
jgi:DNA-binding SARP family transcriptional activator/tetratricopeptide (TPR) repeat protein